MTQVFIACWLISQNCNGYLFTFHKFNSSSGTGEFYMKSFNISLYVASLFIDNEFFRPYVNLTFTSYFIYSHEITKTP